MGLAGPDDKVELPMLRSLTEDKTIRFSWLYPLQWPATIRILEDSRIATDRIITHSAPLDGIAEALARVLNREDHVLKTIIKP
jgi:L-iditol 2-dehydrogenase